MIRLVNAVHIWGEVEAATRTRPLRVQCLDDSGQRFGVFVKLLARSDQGTHLFVNETVGGLYSRFLGLQTPEPLAVEIHPEILGALPNRQIADDIMNSGGLQFGSKDLGPGWHTSGGVPLRTRRKKDLQDALAILLMDIITENGDRSENNPNLLISAKGFAPLDHDLAFSNFPYTKHDRDLFRPWAPASLATTAGRIRRHLLFRLLQGRQLDFAETRARFEGISPAKLSALTREIPDGWIDPASPPERITGYLTEARKNIPTILDTLRHTLTKRP